MSDFLNDLEDTLAVYRKTSEALVAWIDVSDKIMAFDFSGSPGDPRENASSFAGWLKSHGMTAFVDGVRVFAFGKEFRRRMAESTLRPLPFVPEPVDREVLSYAFRASPGHRA